jgi:high mobility group protein B3
MAHNDFHHAAHTMTKALYDSNESIIRKLCEEFDCLDRVDEFKAKFLDDTVLKNVKPKKDKDRPKRAKNAYLIFSTEQRVNVIAKLKKEGKEHGLGVVAKKLGSMWQEMTDEAKTKYQEASEEDKHRYEEEISQYGYK